MSTRPRGGTGSCKRNGQYCKLSILQGRSDKKPLSLSMKCLTRETFLTSIPRAAILSGRLPPMLRPCSDARTFMRAGSMSARLLRPRQQSLREIFLLSIFTLALISTVSGQAVPRGDEINDKSTSVAGSVTDQRGDPIRGATVSLRQLATGKAKTALTDDDGYFVISADPGAFDLQLSAPGFAAKTVHQELTGNQRLDLGKVELTIEVEAAEVVVSVTKQELAEEQVRTEERQRIFGIVPNFLVTYDHNAVPLQARQKYELALRTMVDPETISVDLLSSGLQQKTGGLKGYGTGADGFAKRFASSYGTGSIDTLLGSAALPSLFKQDPRYFYKGEGPLQRRALYAVSMSVICKGDNRHWQYNYSGLLGGLAAGGISNLYYPPANRNGLNVTLENTAIGIGTSAVSNLFQEFLLRRFTRNAKP
jgi:Carboxypeptidase regulatory-like domain